MRVTVALMFAVACFGQGRQNVVQTGTIVPPQATFANPPPSPATGAEWTFIDASAAGACTGGGSAPAVALGVTESNLKGLLTVVYRKIGIPGGTLRLGTIWAMTHEHVIPAGRESEAA